MIKIDECMFCYYLRKSLDTHSRCACHGEAAADGASPAGAAVAAVGAARPHAQPKRNARHPARPQARG